MAVTMQAARSTLYLLGCLAALTSAGSETSVKDLSERDERLGQGVWFVMVHRKECTVCPALLSILEDAAPRYKKSLLFGVMQVSDATTSSWHGLEAGARRAELLLFPGQGKDRFVVCTEEQTRAGVQAFLSHYLAEQAISRGEHDPALKHLKHGLAHKPDSPMMNFYAASIYHQHKRELESAVKHYHIALTDDSKLYNPGRAHYLAGVHTSLRSSRSACVSRTCAT